MYKPSSLDQERASWRTVIYFNVVRSIKHILSTLESWDDFIDDTADSPTSYIGGSSGTSSPVLMNSTLEANGADSRSASPFQGNAAASRSTIASLRRRLSPLVSTDGALADRLSGGVTVSGSGKGGVFVRTGWQARTIENALGRKRPRPSEDMELKKSEEIHDALVQDISRMLEVCKDDVRELWANPTVKALIARRRLKLDEWSELWVNKWKFSSTITYGLRSFLRHITRVAAADYVPSTGTSPQHIAYMRVFMSCHLQMIFFMLVSKPWASRNTFSM